MSVPAADASCDRFAASYVIDLLSDDDVHDLLAEEHRVLAPGGLLCTVRLGRGSSLSAKIADSLWQALFWLQPKLVGGCRAIVTRDYLGDRDWSIRHDNIVTRFGISSEILVACAKNGEKG